MVIAGALAAAVFAGLFLLPVPVGWLLNAGLDLSLPRNSPVRIRLGSGDFRWRPGKDECLLTVREISISGQGLPSAAIAELAVEMPKAELLRLHFAPSRMILKGAAAALDLTATGIPSPSRTGIGVTAALDQAMASRFLPHPGQHSVLTIDGFTLRLRLPSGETQIRFPLATAELAQTDGGGLRGDLSIPIGTGKFGRITGEASLAPASADMVFSLQAPRFATAEVLSFSGAQSFKGTVAIDVNGEFNLAQGRLLKLTGGMQIADSEIQLPGAAQPIALPLLDLRGFIDQGAGKARLESGKIQFAGAELAISELEADLGPRPSVRWQAELQRAQGNVLRELAGELPQLHLPSLAALLDDLTDIEVGTSGSALFTREADGKWAAASVSADCRVNTRIGAEPAALQIKVRQTEGREPVLMTAELAPIHPNLLPLHWQQTIGFAGLDAPVALSASASIAPTGALDSLAVDLRAGSGRLPARMPGADRLRLRSIEARFESEGPASRWRVPNFSAQFADGQTLTLTDADVRFASGRVSARGMARLAGVNGSLIGSWLPPGVLARLSQSGVDPGDVTIDRTQGRIQFEAVVDPKGAWNPGEANAALACEFHVQGTPLVANAQVSLSDAKAAAFVADISEFRPADLKLTLPGGMPARDFDFPVAVRVSAHGDLERGLTDLGVQLKARAGVLRFAPKSPFEISLDSASLVASCSLGSGIVRVQSFDLKSKRIHLEIEDAVSSTAAPYRTSGRLRLSNTELPPLVALCGESIESGPGGWLASVLTDGQIEGADLKWAAAYDPEAPAGLSIGTLQGQAHLIGLRAALRQLPAPLAVHDLALTIDYPKVGANATDLSLPGISLPSVRVETQALGTPEASFAATAHLDADLPIASRLWPLPDSAQFLGTAGVDADLSGLLNGRDFKSRFAVDLAKAKIALPGLSDIAPDAFEAELSVLDFNAPGTKSKGDFTIRAPHWFGEPLDAEGRIDFSPGNIQLADIEFTRFQHGSSSLTASFSAPAHEPAVLRIAGSRIDAAPWLRAVVAVSDAFSAASRPARTTSAGATPSTSDIPFPTESGALDADIECGDVVMGPGSDVRDLKFIAHFGKKGSSSFSLDATTGAGAKLHAALTDSEGGQSAKLTIDDAPAWIALLVAPWRGSVPKSGALAQRIARVAELPSLVTGGSIAADAVLVPGADTWLKGRLQLTHTTLDRAPRALQLLALKSRRSLQRSPIVDELTLDKITIDQKQLRVGEFTLRGSGFITHLKLDKASYGLAGEQVDLEGGFYGIGFVVSGALSDPEVYLKENTFIKAIGHPNEFNFDEPEPSDQEGNKK